MVRTEANPNEVRAADSDRLSRKLDRSTICLSQIQLTMKALIPVVLLLIKTTACFAEESVSEAPRDAYAALRDEMITNLRQKGIRDPGVLAAMKSVLRHEYIPEQYRDRAYEIRPLPIGLDQTISSPFIVAYMTEVADLTPDEKVLEVGTGSGYQAAVLAEMVDSVFTIEILPDLAERARSTLREQGYGSVRSRTGNGYLGWPEEAPFDAIVVTAAPDEIPQALVDQLAVNGRMVIPVGTDRQEMVIVTRTPKGVVEKRTIRVRFVPMTGKPDTR